MPSSEAPAEMGDEGETPDAAPDAADAPEAGEEGPKGITHEPFSQKMHSIIKARQNANGLRHNDHMRYRQYCCRRLRRLFVQLNFKHGRGRWKPAVWPEEVKDVRFLELLLMNAERAWSFGMQLKGDNASSKTYCSRLRKRATRRFGKAVNWACRLEKLAKEHADQRTHLEADAYYHYMWGSFLLEKEKHTEALEKLSRSRRAYEQLSIASEQDESALFKERVGQLAPMIRECRYNLGMGYTGDDVEDDNAPKASSAGGALSDLSYRGSGLAVPSEKLKVQLLKCVSLTQDFADMKDAESAVVIDKYGELSAQFGDVLREIHSDLIDAGAEGQTSEWRKLEAFARELSISMNVERNLLLLRNHLSKLETRQDVSDTNESRKHFKPEEGIRFCDLLKADIESLQELPDTSEAISETLTAYAFVVRNCRCLFMALCFVSIGKLQESAAVLDLLHARLGDGGLGDALQEPLARVHPLFEQVLQSLMPLVSVWRCRGLAKLCRQEVARKAKEKEAAEKPADEEDAAEERSKEKDATTEKKAAATTAPKQEQLKLAEFPPTLREMACKPLLFDLAFPCIRPPDFEAMMAPKGQGGKKGIIGRVAGGIGSRIGGLWGGRK